jgi:hypothetical protein
MICVYSQFRKPAEHILVYTVSVYFSVYRSIYIYHLSSIDQPFCCYAPFTFLSLFYQPTIVGVDLNGCPRLIMTDDEARQLLGGH